MKRPISSEHFFANIKFFLAVYASEVCPVVLRAYLTTYVNICWVIGQLIVTIILRVLLTWNSEWAYRIPFAVQWVWPVPLLIATYFAPESPWWLSRKGRGPDAVDALRRLTSNASTAELEKSVALMIHTNELEKEMEAGTSYWDLFKGVNLRRTEIACVTWACQNLCGNVLQGFSTYFMEQAGLPAVDSYDMAIVQYCLGFIGTLLSWVFMTFFGRRTLFILGLSLLCVIEFIIGFLAIPRETNALSWAIGTMLLVQTFVFDFSIGPATYALVPELASSRLRNKSTGMARNVYNIIGIINGVITPYMLNPTAWNWGAKTGFFWACICFCCLIWTFFRLPEPKGRTYAELDLLFEMKVPARKFSSTKVDPFTRTIADGELRQS